MVIIVDGYRGGSQAKVAPVTFDKFRVKVSLGSQTVSPFGVKVSVLLNSPLRKVSVPLSAW